MVWICSSSTKRGEPFYPFGKTAPFKIALPLIYGGWFGFAVPPPKGENHSTLLVNLLVIRSYFGPQASRASLKTQPFGNWTAGVSPAFAVFHMQQHKFGAFMQARRLRSDFANLEFLEILWKPAIRKTHCAPLVLLELKISSSICKLKLTEALGLNNQDKPYGSPSSKQFLETL